MDWDEYFLKLCYEVSEKSKDDSTKVGAIIVGKNKQIVSSGYNGMPIGVDDSKGNRYERPTKYYFFEHAERNAIFFASRNGVSTEGCSLYVLGPPCTDCARGIIQCGIKEIIFHKQNSEYFVQNQKWKECWKYSSEMLEESGVKVHQIDKILNKKILIGGEYRDV